MEDSDQTAIAQSDLNLRWALMPKGMFSDVGLNGFLYTFGIKQPLLNQVSK